MASNRDWGVAGTTFTLPPGAGPGEPRTVYGAPLPPPLDTYLFRGTDLASSGTIYYYAGGDTYYQFDVAVPSGFGGLGTLRRYVGYVLAGAVVERAVGIPSSWSWEQRGFSVLPNPGPGQIIQNLDLRPFDDWRINDVSQPRGFIGGKADTAPSGAAGAQAVALTSAAVGTGLANLTFEPRRAYRFSYGARWISSVNNTVVVRFQRTNVAGALILGDFSHPVLTGPHEWYGGSNIACNLTGAAINVTVVLTIGPTAGTVTMFAAANEPRYFEVWDVGDAADFPNRPQI